VRQHKQYLLLNIFHGSRLVTEQIRHISKHAKKLSSMADYETSSCRGKQIVKDFCKLLTYSSAAQAWNRNDSRAAKALSLRGQSENDLMRTAHREAASQLYGERNETPSTAQEVFIDLHGKLIMNSVKLG
jgi:hypothetical protein